MAGERSSGGGNLASTSMAWMVNWVCIGVHIVRLFTETAHEWHDTAGAAGAANAAHASDAADATDGLRRRTNASLSNGAGTSFPLGADAESAWVEPPQMPHGEK